MLMKSRGPVSSRVLNFQETGTRKFKAFISNLEILFFKCLNVTDK